jgi:hypothetical protein
VGLFVMPDLIRHPVFLSWIPSFEGMTREGMLVIKTGWIFMDDVGGGWQKKMQKTFESRDFFGMLNVIPEAQINEPEKKS